MEFTVIPSIYDFFFELKIFSDTQMIEAEFLGIDSHVLPNARFWPYCKRNERRQDHGFLEN